MDSSKELRDSIPVEINSLQSQYSTGWFRTFIRNLNKYFPESGAEGPALVATQYSGPMPTGTFRNYAYRTFRDFIQALHGDVIYESTTPKSSQDTPSGDAPGIP